MNDQQRLLRKSRAPDIAIATILFIALFAVGMVHLRSLRTDKSAVSGIELLYGTSVMLAHGKGFISPDFHVYPALRSFLRGETESLPPEALPDTVIEFPSQVAAYHRYLVYTVAFFWRILGVSWSSLEPLLALLLAWSAVAVYGIMRLGMGKTLGLIFTLLFMVSPAMLGILTELRDFSKAPFILSILFMLGWLIKHKVKFLPLLLLAALLGVTAGVGMGFRQDVFIFLPLSVLVLLISALRERHGHRWSFLVVLPVCLLCFLIPAQPLLGRMEGAAHPDHHLVQGFSTKRLDNLGINTPVYRPIASGADCYVFSSLYDFMQRQDEGHSGHFTRNSAGSDEAGRQWILYAIPRFPADLAVRGYAAVLRTLRYADAYPPHFLEPTRLHVFVYSAHQLMASHFSRFGLLYGVVALLIFAACKPTFAMTVFVFALYTFGYVALQCEYRHAFHLSFLPFWLTGFLLTRTVMAARHLRNQGIPALCWWKATAGRVVLTGLCCMTVLSVPLLILRFYQEEQLRPILQACIQAERRALPVTRHTAHGWTHFSVKNAGTAFPRNDLESLYTVLASLFSPEFKLWHARGRYLVAEFDRSADIEWLIHKYESPISLNDFSQLIRLPRPVDDGVVLHYYFPVYELLMPYTEDAFLLARNRFTSLALPEDKAGAFLGLYEVDLPESLVLLMQFVQVDNRVPEGLYQRINFSPDPLFYFQSEKNATENLNLAECARRLGRHTEALFLLGAQLQICRRAETRLTIAHTLVNLDEPDMALDALLDLKDDSEEIQKQQATLLEIIGRRFQIARNPEKTSLAFSRAWELDDRREVELRLELASLLVELSEWEQALGQYRHALFIEPDNPGGVMNANLLLFDHFSPEAGVAFWQSITDTHPETHLPWLYLGKVLESTENTQAASDAFSRAYEADSQDAETLLFYVTTFPEHLLEQDLSIRFANALDERPDLRGLAAERLDKAGLTLLQGGKVDLAQKVFLFVSPYDSDKERNRLRQAQTLAMSDGRHEEAKTELESLLAGSRGREAAEGLEGIRSVSGENALNFWSVLDAKHPNNVHVQAFLQDARSRRITP